MTLPDSGARQEFGTGAVRDISEGKGRCDLLPLDTIDRILSKYERRCNEDITPLYDDMGVVCHVASSSAPTVLEYVNMYVLTAQVEYLTDAVCRFVDDAFDHDPCGAIIELSKHYEDGAKKYSSNNWKLGIDLHCFIDSAIRHYLKHLRGDTDEPHDRAVLWNLVGAIWTHNNHPELDDIHPCEEIASGICRVKGEQF